MPTLQRKSSKGFPGFYPVAAAIIGTITLGAFFNGVLEVSNPKPQPPREYSPLSVLYDQNSVTTQKREQTLRDWCLVQDPTLIALPHPNLGFHYKHPEDPEIPHADFPSYSLHSPEVKADVDPTDIKLPLPDFTTKTDEAAIVHSWPRHNVALPSQNEWHLPKKIIWRTPSGFPLQNAPSIDPEKLKTALEEGKPVHPTELRIICKEDTFHVKITQHSGNLQLDLLAGRTLSTKLLPLHTRPIDNLAEAVLTNLFGEKAGKGANIIEVDWRPKYYTHERKLSEGPETSNKQDSNASEGQKQ